MLLAIAALAVPTSFANTPTGAVLPAGAGVVSLGFGGPSLHVNQSGALGVQLGVGRGFEVAVSASLTQSSAMPPFNGALSYSGAIGVKRTLGVFGGWNAAAAFHGVSSLSGGGVGAWTALPFTREVGAWQWTVGPRVFLPELTSSRPFNGGTLGLLAGGLWHFHPVATLWIELQPAWHATGFPIVAPSIGLRGEVAPGLFLEGGLCLDIVGAGYYPATPEHAALWAASTRYAW